MPAGLRRGIPAGGWPEGRLNRWRIYDFLDEQGTVADHKYEVLGACFGVCPPDGFPHE